MRVRVPLPFRDRIDAYGGATLAQVHEAVTGSVERDVPLSIITSTQRTVGGERLHAYETGEAQSHRGSPIVVATRDGFYLHDGHHRTTAAQRKGQRTIRARVARLDAAPRPFREQSSDDLLMMRPEATAVTYRAHDVHDVAELVGDIAVIEITTPIESKPGAGWGYFDDYESILCRFENALASEDVASVLLKIDSPGGAAAGLNACVDAMIKAKREHGKPVVAFADEGAYSAAYALACVADKIYLPKAGGLGSIGVISRIVDVTEADKAAGVRVETITSGKRKADGDPHVPVTSAAIKHVQRRVDSLAKLYFKLVKESRGVDARAYEADTFYGKHAVKRGLADGVMSLDELVEKMITDLDSVVKIGSTSTREASLTPEARTMNLSTLASALDAALAGGDAKKIAAARAALDKALGAAAPSAKPSASKKIVTTETKSTESSESESSESGSGSEEEEEESGKLPSMSASSSSGSSSGSSEEEEEEEEAAAALALVRSVTGKRSVREAAGALEALRENAASAPSAAKRLAKLEADAKAEKIEKLIARGRAEGKITPGNEPKVRKIAASHGTKGLRAFLDAAVPVAAATDHEPAEEIEGVAVSSEMKKIWTKMGHSESDFPKLAKAHAKTLAKGAR